jgi:hypothetical protein
VRTFQPIAEAARWRAAARQVTVAIDPPLTSRPMLPSMGKLSSSMSQRVAARST